MVRGNSSSSAPKGNSSASGTRARPGTVDVYSMSADGVKTYLGWATDKNKLALFSRAGDRLINPEKYNKHGQLRGGKGQSGAPRRALPKDELIVIPKVDKRAAEIILKWMNDNSITNPKQFELSFELFGRETIPFDVAINVHRAGHAFDLKHETRGQVVRNAIFAYLRDAPRITPDDFKHCMEAASFDGGVTSSMMSQVMWRCVKQEMSEADMEGIKQYCRETDRYEGMARIGQEVIKKKLAARKGKPGRKLTSGWEVEEPVEADEQTWE